MSGDYLGHAVVDGRPRYLSVSSIEKADPRAQGCYRRWWYRYVGGKVEAEKSHHAVAKQAGTDLHAEIARYLRTGEKVLSGLAMRGLHMIPEPGPDLAVEHQIHTVVGDVIRSPLTAAGLPVVGFIDCAHDRGTCSGAEDVSEPDPPGTVELIDWKRKGDATDRDGNSTLMRPEQLVGTTQMSGYGVWMHRVRPQTSHVRLSHGYFPARGGQPRKVTRLHVVDDCLRTWEYVEGVARTIIDVASETRAEQTPANVSACGAYGGCPHREFCPASQTTSLSSLFGETATREITVGLLQQLEGAQNQAPSPPNSPAYTAAIAAAFPAVPPADVRAQVVQEETALRAAQPAQQAAVPQGFIDAWQKIQSYGRGYPGLGGNAALMYASAFNTELRGSGFAGAGQLGAIMLTDPAHVVQLAGELATGPVVPPAPAPPRAPAAVVPTLPTLPTLPATGILAPDAPASNPALASVAPETPTASDAPKRKRGRPKSSETVPTAPIAAAPAATPVAAPIPHVGAVSDLSPPTDVADLRSADLEVFVDCIPNCDYSSLYDYVDHLLAQITKKYCVDKGGQPTLMDVRCAPADGPLGFGRWKGAVHALVREIPPPDKTWYLDTRGNEVAEVVADAMRQVCAARGALYVRGQR